jgi:hypothetical protein
VRKTKKVDEYKKIDGFAGELTDEKLFTEAEAEKAGRILIELGGMTVFNARRLLQKCQEALEQVEV